MVDNFAIPAATIRGLFDYDYRSDRLILRPRVPRTITEYVQKEPVRFGDKGLFISCHNGGTKVKSVAVNGMPLNVELPDAVVLQYDQLPTKAKVEIITDGGWNVEPSPSNLRPTPVVTTVAAAPLTELPESLKRPSVVLRAMDKLLTNEPNTETERAFVREAIGAIDVWRERTAIEPEGCFRPMTTEKRDSIIVILQPSKVGLG